MLPPAIGAYSQLKPDAIGALLILLMKTRYGFEDATAAPGCEAVVNTIGFLFESVQDVLVTKLADQVDAANTSVYRDFSTAAGNRGQTLFVFLGPFIQLALQAAATAAP